VCFDRRRGSTTAVLAPSVEGSLRPPCQSACPRVGCRVVAPAELLGTTLTTGRGSIEPNVQMAYSIETFAWDDDGNLLIKTYYPMPETVGSDSDPYAHILNEQQ
jgi:hypothetical protein